MRGSYYAAQNLMNIGAALGPLLFGMIIFWSQPSYIFVLLVAALLVSGLLYHLGNEGEGVGSRHRRREAMRGRARLQRASSNRSSPRRSRSMLPA